MTRTIYDPNNPEPGMKLNSSGQYVPFAITSDNLNGTGTNIQLPLVVPDTSANNLNSINNNYAMTQQNSFDQGLQNIKNKDTTTNDITNLMKSITDVNNTQTTEQNNLGADVNLKAYKDYNNAIAMENETTRQQIENIQKNNPTGALRGGQQDLINNLTRDSANRGAILTLKRSAALNDYNTAVDTAKAMVDMKVAPLNAELDRLKYVKENNAIFQTAEINNLITRKAAEAKKFEETQTAGTNMIVNAYMQKAPQTTIDKAQKLLDNGGSITDVTKVLGDYALSESDKLDMALKKSNLYTNSLQQQKLKSDLSGGGKLTKITVNGVDYMQDEKGNLTTPKVPDISVNYESTQKSLDNLTFLQNTAKSASDLSSASGVSGAKKFIGDILVGDTKYRQLESLTNTLKTNVLSLMTDPGIKKFFGPQMSNADVELMTSAGTTLNPEKQSPEMLKSEIGRLTDLFTRMQTSIKTNYQSKLDNFIDSAGTALQATNNSYIPTGVNLHP